ncbi:MAG: ATP-binding protein [Pikeienuella sp.]|uniref:ATP-binding protein n=1 Tax=Pikeienuella sp. TaxID=2831957 RepID=UPI00391D195E
MIPDSELDALAEDRAALRRLVEEHRLLREAIEQSPANFCVFDAEDRILAWNPAYERTHEAALAGLKDDPGLPRPTYAEIVRADLGGNAPPAAVEAIVEKQRKADGVSYDRFYDGGLWQRITKYRLPSGGVAGIGVNVSALKEREAALAEARAEADRSRQAKADFLAHMSHEIRTPMNGVLGMTRLLQTTELDERQQLFVSALASSGEALMRIIDDVLDVSKIEAGKMRIAAAPFDLWRTAEDAATLLSAGAAEKGLALHLRIDPTLPRAAIGDAGRLRQIMLNLLGNAVKFTEAGHVLLSLSRVPSEAGLRLRIEVSDTGPGVPEAARAALFSRFAGGETVAAVKGTGLGLSIVAALSRLMEGGAGFESEVGRGSAFWSEVRIEADRLSAPLRAPHAGRALVLDPDPLAARILAERLAGLGVEAAVEEEAGAALTRLRAAAARGEGHGAVFVRRGEAGEAAARALRAEPALRPSALFLVSTVDDDGLEAAAAGSGADGMLTLPLRTEALEAALSAAVARSEAMRRRPPGFEEAAARPF